MYIFAAIKLHFPEKRAALLQRAGIDNFIKPKMSTGSFGTDEKLKKTGVANVRPADQICISDRKSSKGHLSAGVS